MVADIMRKTWFHLAQDDLCLKRMMRPKEKHEQPNSILLAVIAVLAIVAAAAATAATAAGADASAAVAAVADVRQVSRQPAASSQQPTANSQQPAASLVRLTRLGRFDRHPIRQQQKQQQI
uniref:Uncharacterized protein n=1 Tax=Glossina austeni TaxID=7395 RepID=A0A1A9V3M1_GLOAU